jgi:crotonobetainyl-CoA:carnitine CoA-transferase CaiB-like acyl-CoA transferase
MPDRADELGLEMNIYTGDNFADTQYVIKQYSKQEVIDICDKAGICFAPIARPEDLFDDPQLNQGEFGLMETTFPSGEKTKMPRLPVQIGDYDLGKRSDPPAAIGAHTREVLESIGYTSELIRDLAEKKIIAGVE